MRRSVVSLVTLLLAASMGGAAAAATRPPPGIALRDLPGTDGEWQEAAAVVAAPAWRVRAWLVDYARWPLHFSDVDAASVLGATPDHAAIVQFHSRLADRTITIREWQTPWGLRYTGRGGDVDTQGRIYIIDRGDGTTRVVMQCTSVVHGLLGLFATRGLKRDRANEIMTTHLVSLWDLARGRPLASRAR